MIATDLAAVARAVGGRVEPSGAGGVRVTGAARHDSREVGPGDLFVAVGGQRVDGHDHVGDASAAGAAAALTARPVDGLPAVVVPDGDVVAALARLAGAQRLLLSCPVVGVTGSAGKTTAKDLLAEVLTGLGPVVAARASFNNDLGVPLTLLRADGATAALVLEMGARGGGHVRRLCDWSRPDVGVVLNVGSAHLGEFGSRPAIAEAKGELAEAASRRAVLNADDDLVSAMASRARAPVTTFGLGPRADVRAVDVDVDDAARPRFRLVAPQGEADVSLRLTGEHLLGSVLAAATTALVLGVGVEEVAARLSAARPASPHRMALRLRADGLAVLDDSYNANPESVRAALRTLQVLGRRRGARTTAVLGVMAELGETSREEHMDVGRFAVRLDPDQLVVVGPDAGGIHAGAVLEGSWGEESVHVDDVDAAVGRLRDRVGPGDVVLVKASRAARLERVVDALLGDDEVPAEDTAG